jgi:hypothetical protein
MKMQVEVVKWTRIEDGYKAGRAQIFDNGQGVGPSKDSGRWAVTVDGRWIANADTLRDAKALAAGRRA